MHPPDAVDPAAGGDARRLRRPTSTRSCRGSTRRACARTRPRAPAASAAEEAVVAGGRRSPPARRPRLRQRARANGRERRAHERRAYTRCQTADRTSAIVGIATTGGTMTTEEPTISTPWRSDPAAMTERIEAWWTAADGAGRDRHRGDRTRGQRHVERDPALHRAARRRSRRSATSPGSRRWRRSSSRCSPSTTSSCSGGSCRRSASTPTSPCPRCSPTRPTPSGSARRSC